MNIAQTSAVVIYKTTAMDFDEAIDWSCAARGLGSDTIAASVWSVQGADTALETYNPSFDGDVTQIWLRGGTNGNYYTVTNTITTGGGRILAETFLVLIVPYLFITSPSCI